MCDPKDYDMTPVTATLHFDLESAEGERRLKECLDAPKAKEALVEFEKWLRAELDSGCYENSSWEAALDDARDKLFEVFNERGLTPWEI
jgi:hypothetical protein